MKLCLSLLSNGDTEVTKPLARAKTLLESFQAAVEASSLEMTHSPEFQFVDTPPFRRVFLQGCSVSNVCSIYLYGDPERSFFKDDREAVNCPLELVRDPVRGGRTRLPLA